MVIGKELNSPLILPENVYNIDETGVLLIVLNSLKVLVGKNELCNYRATGVHLRRRSIPPPPYCLAGCAPRSTWTVHPTPGWHFGHTETGYTDTAISLFWIQHLFDPQTKARAKDRPRMLINDGFGTHESLEIMKYCWGNNIILVGCRHIPPISFSRAMLEPSAR